MEDEFSLGDYFLEEDFSLGSSVLDSTDKRDPVVLENPQKLKDTVPIKNSDNLLDEVEKIYELLRLKDKDPRLEWEDFFKQDAGIFVLLGKDIFSRPTKEEVQNFEKNIEKWIECAHENWIDIENQHKNEVLSEAFLELKKVYDKFLLADDDNDFFKYFAGEVNKNLNKQFFLFLDQKIKDGILDVSEISELIELAVSIHFISDSPADRQKILNTIKVANNENKFKIESFEETFVRLISEKDDIERIDSNVVIENLFKDYKHLFEISRIILDSEVKTDLELQEDMLKIMSNNNLLVSNIKLFEKEFLEPEIQKKGEFFFNVPLTGEYYYYIKGTATNKYGLTDKQWKDISNSKNIHLDTEFSVAYIMGYKKESTVAGIAKLLKDNPIISKERIIAGDLETYFSHIGHSDIASDIKKLKFENNSNPDELLKRVINLLVREDSDDDLADDNYQEQDSYLDCLLNSDAELLELVKFVIQNKSDEILISDITSYSETQKKLMDFFVSRENKIPYVKFLLNIMNELLSENDISQYKYAFTKIAEFVQSKLEESCDYISFLNIYSILLEKAIYLNIIHRDEIPQNFEQIKDKMKKYYDKNLETYKSLEDTQKQKKTFFRRNK